MLARYRYRIEPTPVQREALARAFGCVRVVFNDAIRLREEAHAAGRTISPTEVQRRVITEAKTTEQRAWLSGVASVALVQSVQDSHRAYRNFFDSLSGKRRGRRVGRPRFKSRKDGRQSFRLTRNGFRLRPDGRLYLAKIGDVAVRWSRDLPCAPSSVTVIREPDGHFHASFVVEVDPAPLPPVERESGVDLGIARLATIACTGGTRRDVANPRHLARAHRKLVRAHRALMRKTKGSANRAKARRAVAVVHAGVARARRDFHHKQALRLVRENQAVYVEDLNIAGMVRNRRLARVVHDAGWGLFVRLLREKAERHGRAVHAVSRWLPSSKTCSGCGYRLEAMPLKIRRWTCPGCGTRHDRDYNAARNILAAGRAERSNACGARIRPSCGMAQGVEAGSTSVLHSVGTPPSGRRARQMVIKNEAESRYEVHVDGELAGFLEYRDVAGVLALVHTEVDDAYAGQGLGGQLAKFALDDVLARGVKISPLCPFVAKYIDKHPEYRVTIR